MSSEVESSSVKGDSVGGPAAAAGAATGDEEENNNPTSSWDGQKKNLPGTPTPERAQPSSPSGDSTASDDTCSICLGRITDKCVTDSCLHSFCLVCLKEWSKQRAVCPLCKLSFTKIMYDIKSEADYKEWLVPQPDPGERSQGIANFQEFLTAETRRFFGYRTTHFPGAAALRRMHPGRSQSIPDAIPSLPPQRRSRYNFRGSTMFRLSVYLNNMWVLPLADITGRYRQTSPQLYREQPALTHRLISWVNRELAALISPSRVGTVLSEVMDLIEMYSINSREFRAAMQPHLDRRTRHFVHEFYHFARSPYDMVGHDNAAQYVPRYQTDEYRPDYSSSEAGNSDDSDAVVEVDATGNPIPSTSTAEGSRGQAAPGNVAREETLTQEGSVVISSSQSSDSESERSQPQSTEASFEMVHNPEPPASALRLIGRAREFLGSVNEGASTSRLDNTLKGNAAKRTLVEDSSDNGDSDECIIVEEVVQKLPTPELIEIDSEDEEHASGQNGGIANDGEEQPYVKPAKKLKGKSKPRLKRNNFFLSEDSKISGTPGESNNIAQKDHSYCTEDGSLGAMPSTSNADNRNSHEEHNQECSSSQEKSQDEPCESDPSFSDESETQVTRRILSSNDSQSQEYSTKDKHRSKLVIKRRYNIRDSSPESGSFRSKKQKLSSTNKGSVKLPKKDLKSKIKSSRHSHSRGSSDLHVEQRHNNSSEHQKLVRESSSDTSVDTYLPSSKSARSSDTVWHRRRDGYSSSEESCNEPRSVHHRSSSTKYRISTRTRKSSKKHRRKSKEKYREKIKRSSSKKKKHKKKSKSKKHESWHRSDPERMERKRRKVRSSGHKRKRDPELLSDSESSSSYVSYKETTVKVRILDNSSGSYSSDTYP